MAQIAAGEISRRFCILLFSCLVFIMGVALNHERGDYMYSLVLKTSEKWGRKTKIVKDKSKKGEVKVKSKGR